MILKSGEWRGRPIVGWRDDGSPIISSCDLVEVEFVPAQPGWVAIEHAEVDCVDSEWWFELYPVVAWKVERSHWWNNSANAWRTDLSVEPVYANGDTVSAGVLVVSPDGKVFGFGEQHRSVEAWEDRQRKQFDADLVRFRAKEKKNEEY